MTSTKEEKKFHDKGVGHCHSFGPSFTKNNKKKNLVSQKREKLLIRGAE